VFTEPASGWADMTQTAKLAASDGAAGDRFGNSVSISGNTVVVGGTQEGPNGPGAAYVFTEPASGWADMTQTAELTASDGAAGDNFGWSVSISGNTVVVGELTPYTVGTGYGPGAAYVFTEPASGWANMTQTAKLTASDGAAGNYFVYSVSISGSTVVVGAPFKPYNSRTGTYGPGAAYVFTEPDSGWANMTQTAELAASDGTAGGYFGFSVSINGNTVVVGASDVGYAFGGKINPGAAYVFTPTPTPLIVTPADWTSAGLTLTSGSDGNLHVYTTGTTTDAVPPSPPVSVSKIEITSPSDTTANLTIDSTAGNPIPAGGLNYSGGGGLIITGSGSVTLAGPNRYTGGTTISAGRLLINAASALPGGGSLTVDAGGTFVFDPSQSASSVMSATNRGATVPVASAGETPAPLGQALTTNVVSSIPGSSAPTDVVKPSTSGRNWQSPIVPSAALRTPLTIPAVPLGTRAKSIARDLASLAPAANSSDNSDQQRKKDLAILALEAVFAQYDR